MSRVGKQPVKIQQGVKVNIAADKVEVQGPKGKLSTPVPSGIKLEQKGDEILVTRVKPELAAQQGTVRSLVNNMIHGVHSGFKRELDIIGVGYRAAVKGKMLNLTLGFSHPVEFPLPEGIEAKVEKNTHIILSGADRMQLGMAAAKIRSFRPPEPYQGKGVRYSDEHIMRKQGKAAGAK